MVKVGPRRRLVFSASSALLNLEILQGIPSVQRLDLTKNPSLAAQPDFHHGLLADTRDEGRRLPRETLGIGRDFEAAELELE